MGTDHAAVAGRPGRSRSACRTAGIPSRGRSTSRACGGRHRGCRSGPRGLARGSARARRPTRPRSSTSGAGQDDGEVRSARRRRRPATPAAITSGQNDRRRHVDAVRVGSRWQRRGLAAPAVAVLLAPEGVATVDRGDRVEVVRRAAATGSATPACGRPTGRPAPARRGAASGRRSRGTSRSTARSRTRRSSTPGSRTPSPGRARRCRSAAACRWRRDSAAERTSG